MEKKYIFFDIDGTLTNDNPGGVILPSTHQTIKKLKDNGHFVAIATGRSYRMAKEMIELAHIDHIVCSGGNGLIVEGKLLYEKPLDKQKAMCLIKECLEKNIVFGVVVDQTGHVYTHYSNFNEMCPEIQGFAQICYMEEANYEQFDEIHKIHVALKKGEKNPLQSFQTTDLHYARYHEYSIIVEPDDKFKGILDMMAYVGGNVKDIVVFGDGHNDLSMIRQAPISIAMGNAIDELKQLATFVTKDCQNDGIEYACQYFGWI
jgi:HAD-superfamily hydrolase, subfamily IIB